MEPFSETEHALLTDLRSDELAKRIEFARSIGNHQVDPFLMRQAIFRTARRYYQSQGLSESELEQRAPLLAPPPAWRGMPTVGKVKVFALLIEFNDTTPINAASTINAALWGAPTTGAPYESLAAYYKRASYGKLDLSSGATLGWYKFNQNRSDVVQTRAGREGLIKEALQYFDQQGHDFKQYDNNGDGVVDYFMIFWAGADNGWGNFWWGYQTNFSDSSFKLDGVCLGKYSWQWESRPVGSVFNPRVCIHETGHALGLPDLYDYDENQGPDGGVGGADMMDDNQYDHNAFSKWMLDWIELNPANVVGSGAKTLTLNGSGTTEDCVVIWPGIDNDDLFSEFFIAQNRQPEGNDSQLPQGGLMIWHVDARLDASGNNFAYDNSWAAHKLVRLMEADGKEDIEANRRFDVSDLYTTGKIFGPNTLPASTCYSGASSGVEIRDIVVSGKQIKATFSIQSQSSGSWRLWNYNAGSASDCLPGNPVGQGQWRSIHTGHVLVPMQDGRVLDWVPADGTWRLWNYNAGSASDCLPGNPVGQGQWRSIRTGHVLVPMQDGRVLDWVPADGTWRLWNYNAGSKNDCLPGNPVGQGQWRSIRTGHVLVPMQDGRVLDWVPADGTWRLWNYNAGSKNDCLPGNPVGQGQWRSIRTGHILVPMQDGRVLDWVPADGTWRLWNYNAGSKNDCLPGNPVGQGQWRSIRTGHLLIPMHDGKVLDWVT